jgi:hypothetical protein
MNRHLIALIAAVLTFFAGILISGLLKNSVFTPPAVKVVEAIQTIELPFHLVRIGGEQEKSISYTFQSAEGKTEYSGKCPECTLKGDTTVSRRFDPTDAKKIFAFLSDKKVPYQRIIEFGPKLNEKNEQIGERLINVSREEKDEEVTICWTDGPTTWFIRAPDITTAREFEDGDIFRAMREQGMFERSFWLGDLKDIDLNDLGFIPSREWLAIAPPKTVF